MGIAWKLKLVYIAMVTDITNHQIISFNARIEWYLLEIIWYFIK